MNSDFKKLFDSYIRGPAAIEFSITDEEAFSFLDSLYKKGVITGFDIDCMTRRCRVRFNPIDII